MKKNILLVVNPISGDVDKSDIVLLTKAFGEKINCNVVVFSNFNFNVDSPGMLSNEQRYFVVFIVIVTSLCSNYNAEAHWN